MRALLVGAGLDLMSVSPGAAMPVATPFGPPSAAPLRLTWGSEDIWLLPRHGMDHSILPHRVNYRANLWALREVGALEILAVHSVGTLDENVAPGTLAIPTQLIDYTWGRASSFEGYGNLPRHVEMDPPFDRGIQEELAAAARRSGIALPRGGTYGVTQGPRLETSAEIDRLEQDGCAFVGMTAMPEAGLARELGLPYASCVVAVNFAAGRNPDGSAIHDQLAAFSRLGFGLVEKLLTEVFNRTASSAGA